MSGGGALPLLRRGRLATGRRGGILCPSLALGPSQPRPGAIRFPDPATTQCQTRAAAEQADEPDLATI